MFSTINLALYRFSDTAANIIDGGAKQACPAGSCGVTDVGTVFASVSKLLLFIIGAISILMVIIGGLRYVLSAGDPKATAGAKDTILYAVVGLVLALSAFSIVHFVLRAF